MVYKLFPHLLDPHKAFDSVPPSTDTLIIWGQGLGHLHYIITAIYTRTWDILLQLYHN